MEECSKILDALFPSKYSSISIYERSWYNDLGEFRNSSPYLCLGEDKAITLGLYFNNISQQLGTTGTISELQVSLDYCLMQIGSIPLIEDIESENLGEVEFLLMCNAEKAIQNYLEAKGFKRVFL